LTENARFESLNFARFRKRTNNTKRNGTVEEQVGTNYAHALNPILTKFGMMRDPRRVFSKFPFQNDPSTNFDPGEDRTISIPSDKAYRL